MIVESAVGIALVVGFCIVIAATVVPLVAFIWSFTYRMAIKPLVDRLPEPVQKVLRPMLEMPQFQFRFRRKQTAKRAR